MRASDAFWRTVEIAVPCLLVLASVVLMASAVGAMLLGSPREEQWTLFGSAVACWACGIGWGILVNDRGSWLRKPW